MGVNKVQLANGETIIDISDSTVTPETLAEGVTAHDASGQKITGKMVPGGGSSVQTDWNQTDETAADFLKNKPFRVASLNFETMALDMTPEEINEVIMSGGAVLFSYTMTPIGCDTSDDDITAVYASSIVGTVEGDEGILVAAVFKFSPTDGSFMGAQTFLFSGGIILG